MGWVVHSPVGLVFVPGHYRIAAAPEKRLAAGPGRGHVFSRRKRATGHRLPVVVARPSCRAVGVHGDRQATGSCSCRLASPDEQCHQRKLSYGTYMERTDLEGRAPTWKRPPDVPFYLLAGGVGDKTYLSSWSV